MIQPNGGHPRIVKRQLPPLALERGFAREMAKRAEAAHRVAREKVEAAEQKSRQDYIDWLLSFLPARLRGKGSTGSFLAICNELCAAWREVRRQLERGIGWSQL